MTNPTLTEEEENVLRRIGREYLVARARLEYGKGEHTWFVEPWPGVEATLEALVGQRYLRKTTGTVNGRQVPALFSLTEDPGVKWVEAHRAELGPPTT
jgi:hypothetical protein